MKMEIKGTNAHDIAYSHTLYDIVHFSFLVVKEFLKKKFKHTSIIYNIVLFYSVFFRSIYLQKIEYAFYGYDF